ncbi:MAG: hypothetical protein AB7G23_01455 [Vicinamibacterales bacterium]
MLPREWTEPVPGGPGDQPTSSYGVLALQIAPADARIVIDGEAWASIEGQAEFGVELTEGQATRLHVQSRRRDPGEHSAPRGLRT